MRFLILAIALALTASSCLALRAPGRLDLPPAANHRDKWSTQPIAADIPVAVPSPAPPSPVPSPQPASSPCICNPPPLAGPTIAGEAEAIIKRLTPPDFASDGNCDYEHDPATDSPPVPAVSQGACICVPTAVATVSSTEQNPAAAPLHTTATLITTQLIISPTLAPLLVSTIYETIHQNIAVQEVQQTVNVVSTVLQPLAPPPSPSPTPSLLPAPAPKILLQVDSGISIIKHDTKGKTEQIQAVEEGFQVEFEPLKAGMGESTFTASWGKAAALSVMDVRLLTSG